MSETYRGPNELTAPVSAIFDPRTQVRLPYNKMTGDVFKRVTIMTQPLGGSLIAWELWPNLMTQSPMHFYVDFGRSGTNEWETLNTLPIINECLYSDLTQRQWDQKADFYYRMRLVLPGEIDPLTNLPKVYLSVPQHAGGLWSKRDWLTARMICRKEYLRQRKATNRTAVGYLLKLKKWGQVSKTTVDWDTGEVQHADSEIDFGTGFIGGYYAAVEFTCSFENAPWDRQFTRDPSVSVRNDSIRSARAVAYPYIDSGDIFVRRDNGERHVVFNIKSAAEVGGIPIVVLLELRLAPATDIVYKIPLHPGPTPPVSSSSSSQNEEWRVGKDDVSW